MCGLFGAIGKNWNIGIIRALTLCNRDRGTHSLGFFDCSGNRVRRACDPFDALRCTAVNRWLSASAKGNENIDSSWFIAGHTRYATRGVINRQNSHPFRFGNIIGSHNGIVEAPRRYSVDSMYLFDLLNKHDGDYNTAWHDIVGYWAVTWFDGEAFFLQTYNNTLYIGMADDGVLYYSSERGHLETCIGKSAGMHRLGFGETIKFTYVDDELEWNDCDKFVGCNIGYWEYRHGVSNAKF